MHPDTRRQALDALRREALSVLRQFAYAAEADASGDEAAGETPRRLAYSDLGHSAALLRPLGWISDLRDNVLGLLIGDVPIHGAPYARYAHETRQRGDHAVADVFEGLVAEETEAGQVMLDLLDRPRSRTLIGGGAWPTGEHLVPSS